MKFPNQNNIILFKKLSQDDLLMEVYQTVANKLHCHLTAWSSIRTHQMIIILSK